MPDQPALRTVGLRRAGPVVMCRKCLKRMADGGKLKRRLKASLQARSAGQKKNRARLVLTNCFGICPKGAVVAGSPTTCARSEFLLIQDSSREVIEQATAALL